MCNIIEIQFVDYALLYGEERRAYSDFAVKNALTSGGRVYSMIEKEVAVGYICVLCEPNINTITYAYTTETHRNQGVFSKLVAFVIENFNKPIRVSISTNIPAFMCVKHICQKYGFVMGNKCVVYSANASDFVKWEQYMQKTGDRLVAYLEKQGYTTISFENAQECVLKQVYDSEKSGFANKLSVRPFFENTDKCLDKKASYIAVKNGDVVAYTLITKPDKNSFVFEHISVAEEYYGSGCILLPFAKSMERFKIHECKRASYAMYENNTHANAFRKKILEIVTSKQTIFENYILY